MPNKWSQIKKNKFVFLLINKEIRNSYKILQHITNRIIFDSVYSHDKFSYTDQDYQHSANHDCKMPMNFSPRTEAKQYQRLNNQV